MITLTLKQLWTYFEPSIEEEEKDTLWFIKDGVEILLDGVKPIFSIESQSDELYLNFDTDGISETDDMDLYIEGDEVFNVVISQI